ncbi:hypothetical protein [Micromonospora trifolii]|uniref:hypothetical protein n=1 Tax=Micromonospora trifolii TaxID=2911208 RepID=UPI003CF80173
MTDVFWAYSWMDEHDISSESDVRRAIESDSLRSSLLEAAEGARQANIQAGSINPDMDAVLAGRAIDLSGHLTCMKCGGPRVVIDEVFRSVWHYFDAVIVEGFSPIQASDILKAYNSAQDYVSNTVSAHLNALLEFRELGVDDMLIFRQKFIPCSEHWESHLTEAGLESIKVQAGDIVSVFESQGRLESLTQRAEGRWSYSYYHPLLGDGPLFGSLIQEEGSADPVGRPRRAVAESVFKHFAGRLVADVRSAQVYGVPLGAALNRNASASALMSSEPDEASVAIALRLPRLEGVPLADLIRIRRDESLSFDRFRIAMRSAIRERVRSAGNDSASKVAREIRQDIIEPALLEIEGKLTAARKVLARKTGASIALTSFATAVGLAANIPLLLPAGVATGLAAAATVNYGKYLEEVRDAEQHELYFLWRLGSYQH